MRLAQADLIFAGHTGHFDGFVMLRLICFSVMIQWCLKFVIFIRKNIRCFLKLLIKSSHIATLKIKNFLVLRVFVFDVGVLPWSGGRNYMSPVKRFCVFEHSVMTNFNCACPGIQRGQGSDFPSEGSSWLTASSVVWNLFLACGTLTMPVCWMNSLFIHRRLLDAWHPCIGSIILFMQSCAMMNALQYSWSCCVWQWNFVHEMFKRLMSGKK